MNPLDTLQSLVLAAKAAGDDDTAEWLASLADDPAQVAAVTGGVGDQSPSPPSLTTGAG